MSSSLTPNEISEKSIREALFPDFDLDGVPVGEVAVDADDADVLGVGVCEFTLRLINRRAMIY
ncbi:MAG: hypothetical protein HN494_05215 [Opitutae bacterium]|nr:hypothetical protein [Opitutae bacterium]MBT6852171.1 hypothetical protein [Opitutae bacterium]MBT7742211.1 hypothetical protein [Opitutae bacterium]